MAVSDVLLRGRDAARRLSEIDTELAILHSRLGPQGHSYEFHGKSDVLDPMRKVISLMDSTEDMEREMAACQADVMEADTLCRGVSREVSQNLGHILHLYYVGLRSVRTIADVTHTDHHVVESCISRATLQELDKVGVPKLMQAGAEVGEHQKTYSDVDLSSNKYVAPSGVQP